LVVCERGVAGNQHRGPPALVHLYFLLTIIIMDL
jgi:hypothetical protein